MLCECLCDFVVGFLCLVNDHGIVLDHVGNHLIALLRAVLTLHVACVYALVFLVRLHLLLLVYLVQRFRRLGLG